MHQTLLVQHQGHEYLQEINKLLHLTLYNFVTHIYTKTFQQLFYMQKTNKLSISFIQLLYSLMRDQYVPKHGVCF